MFNFFNGFYDLVTKTFRSCLILINIHIFMKNVIME